MMSAHELILWLAAAVSLIVSGLLVASLLRLRRKSAAEAEPNQTLPNSPVLEAIWTLTPLGILIALLVLTFLTMQSGR